MKITNLLAIATTLLLMACNKPAQPIVPEESNFKGTVTVIYQDAPFQNENIEVNFKPSADGKTGSLTIYQIKFVPQMPVTIDVTIPNINVTSTPEQINLECAQVIPLAMGGEYPRYTVTDLKGSIVGKEISFSLNFGSIPTSYKGKME